MWSTSTTSEKKNPRSNWLREMTLVGEIFTFEVLGLDAEALVENDLESLVPCFHEY